MPKDCEICGFVCCRFCCSGGLDIILLAALARDGSGCRRWRVSLLGSGGVTVGCYINRGAWLHAALEPLPPTAHRMSASSLPLAHAPRTFCRPERSSLVPRLALVWRVFIARGYTYVSQGEHGSWLYRVLGIWGVGVLVGNGQRQTGARSTGSDVKTKRSRMATATTSQRTIGGLLPVLGKIWGRRGRGVCVFHKPRGARAAP